jgi:hypothetical protein
MKPVKMLLVVTAAALITLGLGGYALAFHDGGVAHCDGCHTMHNSENGESIIQGGTVGTAGDHLTIGATPSSTCLSCHARLTASYGVLGADTNVKLTPGGDFLWVTKTYVYSSHGTHTNEGDNHGHNVIAPDYGLNEDMVNVPGTAPGGSYPVSNLHCSSCHDPHGKKINKTGPIEVSGSYGADPTAQVTGNFRLLGDVGYSPGTGTVTFTKSPPIATTAGFGDYRDFGEGDGIHTDYGVGMSEWCSNCHTQFLAGGPGQHKHPAGDSATLAGLADNYNEYISTGVTNPSNKPNAYLALVPFERQISDPTVLDPNSTVGPETSANVMCLTCHRAHASAFPNAGRWDFETEFPAVDSHPKDSDQGAFPGAELASYYKRDMVALFGASQRSFCNKCHMQD